MTTAKHEETAENLFPFTLTGGETPNLVLRHDLKTRNQIYFGSNYRFGFLTQDQAIALSNRLADLVEAMG